MKAESLTVLVKQSGVSLNAATILAAIRHTDLVEEVEYVSTSGSGEIKSFLRLTDAGLAFGVNKDGAHEIKTEARFFAETFPGLLRVIIQRLGEEVDRMDG